MTQLPDGVIVVSGASRGIGRDLVALLLQFGCEVITLARHSGAAQQQPEQDLDPSAGACASLMQLQADLGSEAGVADAIVQLQRVLAGRPVAALVNGAGAVTPLGPLQQHSSAALLQALCLMAVAPAQLAAALTPLMPPGGRILNLSSRSAHETFPGLGAYCMAKHALHAVSQSLRLELAPAIGVAELIPGEVDTAMQAELRQPEPEQFALASFFRANRCNLIPSPLAAQFCQWVLMQTPLEQFNRDAPWFIYDTELQARWLPPGAAFPFTAT